MEGRQDLSSSEIEALQCYSQCSYLLSYVDFESWKELKGTEERVRRFEGNCLRRIMKIRWYDHVSEEELRRSTGQQSVVEKIKLVRWKSYGHVLRIPEERITK